MVVVAVAGPSSGLGLTFVQVAAQDSSVLQKHKFVLLSRSAQPQWGPKGIESRQVDYTSHEQLIKALEGVHTVLCFIGMYGGSETPIALINAAKEAGVTRFAPAEYGGHGSYDVIDAWSQKKVIWDAAKDAGFEVTNFECGIFMNILGTGTPKPLTLEGEQTGYKTGEEEALAGLRPWNYVINMKSGTADFVQDGSTKLVLTDTRDIAKFVLASLDLELWPEKLGMQGSVTSFKDIVAFVEKVQARKFLIKENSHAELEAQTQADPGKAFYNQSRVAISNRWAMVEPDLNKAFPHIKPVTMEEYVDRWWSGVELGKPSWTEDVSFTGVESQQ